jgi:hypothetical protein
MSTLTSRHPPGYEQARLIAFQGGEAERAALAAAAATAPEILYYLAGDQAPEVRQAVAANGGSPPLADQKLSLDAQPEVRVMLGRKLAAMAPGLSAHEQDRLRKLSWDTLCTLVEDTAVQVRAAIADSLKEMPDAPRALILRLARDAEMSVAEPVIRLSPLLDDEDLLALVTLPPVPATVVAVARRPCLSEALSDAIVATADAGTVAVLLDNASASIREATLDALIASAATKTSWQEKLVHRPSLSARCARALGEIVADQFLALLAGRDDLDPEVTETLRAKVADRMPGGEPPALAGTEAEFRAAAERGDRAEMAALLAAATQMEPAAITRAMTLRSARALVALCWHAAYSPAAAVLAQSVMGQLAPDACLYPGPQDSWPLAPDEMNWQLELLTSV